MTNLTLVYVSFSLCSAAIAFEGQYGTPFELEVFFDFKALRIYCAWSTVLVIRLAFGY